MLSSAVADATAAAPMVERDIDAAVRQVPPSQPGHGRLAFLGYNVLIGIFGALFSAMHPILALIALPFCYANIKARLQNIGWNSGLTWLWTLGCCVPLLNLILGLSLLFTPGKSA